MDWEGQTNMNKRPTPNSRAFRRSVDCGGKTCEIGNTDEDDCSPIARKLLTPDLRVIQSTSKLSTRKLRDSPFSKAAPCPPTPGRTVPRTIRKSKSRKKRMTLGHSNLRLLSETMVLFQSPFRPAQQGGEEDDKAMDVGDEENAHNLLEQFEYLNVLGDGVCGVVHRARSRQDNRLYAIKRYKQSFLSISERKRILNAMTIWAEMKICTNVVPLYQAWQENGHLCLQMHLCSGGDLQGYVDNCLQGIKGDILWRCFGDVLKALEHCHAQRILHNDVKPGNMYVSCQDSDANRVRIMLGDFDQVSRFGDVVDSEGDSKYIAKDILADTRTWAADIFSAAISFYQLYVQLELPEAGEMWHRFRDGPIPAFPRDLEHPLLYSLLSEMMHPDFRKRPSATELLRQAQFKLSQGVALPFFENTGIQQRCSPFTVLELSSDEDGLSRSSFTSIDPNTTGPPTNDSTHKTTEPVVPSSRMSEASSISISSPRRSLFQAFEDMDSLDL